MECQDAVSPFPFSAVVAEDYSITLPVEILSEMGWHSGTELAMSVKLGAIYVELADTERS